MTTGDLETGAETGAVITENIIINTDNLDAVVQKQYKCILVGLLITIITCCWLKICGGRVGDHVGHGHVEANVLCHGVLVSLHPHEPVHTTQQTHALLPVEAEQDPDRALVLSTFQDIENIRYLCCASRQRYGCS